MYLFTKQTLFIYQVKNVNHSQDIQIDFKQKDAQPNS